MLDVLFLPLRRDGGVLQQATYNLQTGEENAYFVVKNFNKR